MYSKPAGHAIPTPPVAPLEKTNIVARAKNAAAPNTNNSFFTEQKKRQRLIKFTGIQTMAYTNCHHLFS